MSERNLNKKREYCDLLGVGLDADEEQVKKAYRRLVLEYHPDRPGNKGREQEANAMFNKINEAYEQLSSGANTLNLLKGVFKSQDLHNSLEQFLFTRKSSSFVFNPPGAVQNSKEKFEFGNLHSHTSSTLLHTIFQQQQQQQQQNTTTTSANSTSTNLNSPPMPTPTTPTPLRERKAPKPGQSLQTNLKIGFFESLSGCVKTIEYNRNVQCRDCAGTGIINTRADCRDCMGKGQIEKAEGTNTLIIPCSSCYSSGHTHFVQESCKPCAGTGKSITKKTATITVPAGVFSSMKKVYEGEGDEGTDGGTNGDLIIFFEVENHPFYQRPSQGTDDVFCRISVPFPNAALGTQVEVPSMYGKKLHINLEPGTQHEQMVTVKDEGFFNISKQKRGDMHIQIAVEVPKFLNEEERMLLSKLAKQPNFRPLFPCT